MVFVFGVLNFFKLYVIMLIFYIEGEVLQLAYKISSECINCGACESECPVDAISAGGDVYVVNADTCIDCGACESACPVSAISAE